MIFTDMKPSKRGARNDGNFSDSHLSKDDLRAYAYEGDDSSAGSLSSALSSK